MSKITELNDAFRRTFVGGKVVMTAGVTAMNPVAQLVVVAKVKDFEEFSKDVDPYGEHDFGSFEVAGQKFFWKIDYYAPDMEGGSEDPSDPTKTTRVLTIMLADEY